MKTEDKRIKVKMGIEGETPLIMNIPHPKIISKEIDERKLKPSEICELKIYRDAEGKICIPDSYISGLFNNAIRSLGLGSSKDDKKLKEVLYNRISLTEKPTLVGDFLIPLKTKSYIEYARVVSLDGKEGGPKGIKYRPKFDEWGAEFTLYVDIEDNAQTDRILDKIRLVFENGGKNVGIGDGTSINAGRFKVTQFKRVE